MSQEKEVVFFDGIRAKENTKLDFILADLGFNTEKVIEFLRAHDKNGWVNGQLKKSKSGNLYIQLDTWEPQTDDIP